MTLLLQELHWLNMRQRIEYKLAVLVYRCLNGLASSYLANDLQCVADIYSLVSPAAFVVDVRTRRPLDTSVHHQ